MANRDAAAFQSAFPRSRIRYEELAKVRIGIGGDWANCGTVGVTLPSEGAIRSLQNHSSWSLINSPAGISSKAEDDAIAAWEAIKPKPLPPRPVAVAVAPTPMMVVVESPTPQVPVPMAGGAAPSTVAGEGAFSSHGGSPVALLPSTPQPQQVAPQPTSAYAGNLGATAIPTGHPFVQQPGQWVAFGGESAGPPPPMPTQAMPTQAPTGISVSGRIAGSCTIAPTANTSPPNPVSLDPFAPQRAALMAAAQSSSVSPAAASAALLMMDGGGAGTVGGSFGSLSAQITAAQQEPSATLLPSQPPPAFYQPRVQQPAVPLSAAAPAAATFPGAAPPAQHGVARSVPIGGAGGVVMPAPHRVGSGSLRPAPPTSSNPKARGASPRAARPTSGGFAPVAGLPAAYTAHASDKPPTGAPSGQQEPDTSGSGEVALFSRITGWLQEGSDRDRETAFLMSAQELFLEGMDSERACIGALESDEGAKLLVEMGFPLADVRSALIAAKMDVAQAADILSS